MQPSTLTALLTSWQASTFQLDRPLPCYLGTLAIKHSAEMRHLTRPQGAYNATKSDSILTSCHAAAMPSCQSCRQTGAKLSSSQPEKQPPASKTAHPPARQQPASQHCYWIFLDMFLMPAPMQDRKMVWLSRSGRTLKVTPKKSRTCRSVRTADRQIPTRQGHTPRTPHVCLSAGGLGTVPEKTVLRIGGRGRRERLDRGRDPSTQSCSVLRLQLLPW
jgi:hypothetical protein